MLVLHIPPNTPALQALDPKSATMAEEPTSTEFQFVNSTIATPMVPQDQAMRALIRKQAMKKVSAARRRYGNYGKQNVRQYPIFIIGKNDNTDGEICKSMQELDHKAEIGHLMNEIKFARRRKWCARSALGEPIPPRPPANENTLASPKSEFDILDLSTFATFHVNRAAWAVLSQNPQLLILQLRANKPWSYLSFLPQHMWSDSVFEGCNRLYCCTGPASNIS
jgi:hypothetical protein